MQKVSRLQQLWVYVVTTSYLKPTQVIHRIRMVLYHKILHRSRRYRSSYEHRATGHEPFVPIEFPFVRPAATDVAETGAGKFTFLNHTADLGMPTMWQPQSETQLWLYNLHYFDYVRDIARLYQGEPAESPYLLFRRLVSEWIDNCPVATPVAWDSYPIAFRVNNWLRAYTVFQPELVKDDEFAQKIRRSIYIQTAFLEKHLEYHLLNNHLLENGRTLWLVGHFFQGAEPDRWRKKGHTILWDGLKGHFLADGGHDELSPMYHQIMLDMYQEVADVMVSRGETVPTLLADRLQGMRRWLAAVLHPDGNLSLFSDSALGIAGDPADFIGDEPTSIDGLTALDASGYFVFRDAQKQHFLMFDCGVVGPDHRLGHGHCDALSFELSIAGNRMIVDAGVSDYYGDIQWRDYYRGTRAHNTVMVDETEQSEIWDRFRVARRARLKDVAWSETEKLTYVTAAHTGFERLPGKVVHRRWVCWVDRRFWVICDRLEGEGTHTLESFLHFHPDVTQVSAPTQNDCDQVGEVTHGDATLRVLPWGLCNTRTYCGEDSPLQGWYAAEFGLNTRNTVWGFSENRQLPAWSGYVLWPEASAAALEVTESGNTSTLAIRAADRTYQLMIESAGVMLKTSDY